MSAQLTAILDDLERHKHAFDFNDNGLADAVAEATSVGIFEYLDREIDVNNSPFIALSEGYEAWKSRHFPGKPIGELYGLMKSPDQLKGTLEIQQYAMSQTYGTTEEARLLAEWFQEGYAPQNRPPRPFYGLNDLVLVLLDTVFENRFADAVR